MPEDSDESKKSDKPKLSTETESPGTSPIEPSGVSSVPSTKILSNGATENPSKGSSENPSNGPTENSPKGSSENPSRKRSSENPPASKRPSVTKKQSSEAETGSTKTQKSSASSKGGTLEKMLGFMFPNLNKHRESTPSSSRKSLPEKLSSTSKKSPDYMKEKAEGKAQLQLAKKVSEMKLKEAALMDDRLDKSPTVEVEHRPDGQAKSEIEQQRQTKPETDRQPPPLPATTQTEKQRRTSLDIVKRHSIDIIRKKVLTQGRVAPPPLIEEEHYRIAHKQQLDTDVDVFSVIDSKELQKRKEPKVRKEPKEPKATKEPKGSADSHKSKKSKGKRRHKHRKRRHGHSKDSKLVNLLTKRRILQKALEENLLIKKIKENCELRSGHIKTDIRLAYKNNSLVIEPVINSDLLFDNQYKTELEKLIDTSRRSIGKRSALNDASLLIRSIEEDSRVLKSLNKEIENELNDLNKIKLEKKAKVVKNRSTSPAVDKGKQSSDAKKSKESEKLEENLDAKKPMESSNAKKSKECSDTKRSKEAVKSPKENSDAKKSKEGSDPKKEAVKSPKESKKVQRNSKEGSKSSIEKNLKKKSSDGKPTKEVEKNSDEAGLKKVTKSSEDKNFRKPPTTDAKPLVEPMEAPETKKVDSTEPKKSKDEPKIKAVLEDYKCPTNPVAFECYRNETFSSRMDVEIERELAKKGSSEADSEPLDVIGDDGEPGQDNVEVDVDEASLRRDNTVDDAKRLEVMNSEIKLREILKKEIRAKQGRDQRPSKERRIRPANTDTTKAKKKSESSSSDDPADRVAVKRDGINTEPFKE